MRFSAFQAVSGFLQDLIGQLLDVAPGSLDVMQLSGACADGEAQNEALLKLARHQVDLPLLGDLLQQFLVNLVGALLEESSSPFVKIFDGCVCVL